MSRALTLAPGFVAAAGDGGTLIAEPHTLDAFRAAGLDRSATWETAIAAGKRHSGRGATACFEADRLGVLRLKQLRRSGWLAPLWCERFLGTRRLLRNLSDAREAIRRGVATPEVRALWLRPGPPGFWRGWLAVEEVPDARDLAVALTAADPPSAETLTMAAVAVRRMHDAGVEHRDLNLGNLLVREHGPRSPQAWVLDLDRARLHGAPLGLAARSRGLRRLVRSTIKVCGSGAVGGIDVPSLWFEAYAGADAVLLGRLRRL